MSDLLPTSEGRPKRDIIRRAYSICGIAKDTLSPEDMADGLEILNMQMMDTPWSLVAYNQPSSGNGDVGDPSGLENAYIPAVMYELAKRLAVDMGKGLSPEASSTLARTRASFRALIATAPTMLMRPGVHLGSGRRDWVRGDMWSVDGGSPPDSSDPGDLASLAGG
jgi:hypothetical protein